MNQENKSEVVVTTNELGECVAVTRQDEEGKILSVIWMKKGPSLKDAFFEGFTSVVTYNDSLVNSVDESWETYRSENKIKGGND